TLSLSREGRGDLRPGCRAGYSLIEILVALTLFSVAALGLSAGVATVVRSGKLSEDFTQATILAQDKLEDLCAQVVSLNGGSDTPRPGFTRVWAITPDSPETGVARVDVSVSWGDSPPHTVALTTVVNE
ncbi:MAG: prepilin-type N-terminal cleavage/methylation domain-containing protein, partial [Deltaproteobacteria bacterium]|nr:prepilin-type N-terminal cleavage/methylation domain-containing protein [Deltaproteobacteria bacterium]